MSESQLPAINPAAIEPYRSFDPFYPSPFNEPCRGREWRQLGDAAGLTQFGVNLTVLAPGAWSAQRHWHLKEEEFVYVLEGELVLISDRGEQLLTKGMGAGFPAGVRDGHHLINRSDRPATFLEIGTRPSTDDGEYPDIDMKFEVRAGMYKAYRRSGEPYVTASEALDAHDGGKPRNTE
jgi:uncharacterized cupin superfamily protein